MAFLVPGGWVLSTPVANNGKAEYRTTPLWLCSDVEDPAKAQTPGDGRGWRGGRTWEEVRERRFSLDYAGVAGGYKYTTPVFRTCPSCDDTCAPCPANQIFSLSLEGELFRDWSDYSVRLSSPHPGPSDYSPTVSQSQCFINPSRRRSVFFFHADGRSTIRATVHSSPTKNSTKNSQTLSSHFR